MVLFGTQGATEIWETGFWLAGGLPSSDDAAALQAEVVFNVLLSESDPPVIPAIRSLLLPDNGAVVGMRCYAYPTGGPTATYSGEYTAPTPLNGTSSHYLPWQSSIVVTLRTGASGRRNRGRMYLPAAGAALGADSQMSNSDITTLVNNWAAAFTDLAGSDAGTPSVVSIAGSAHRAITTVEMDSRVDIQRRRANKQVASSVATHTV